MARPVATWAQSGAVVLALLCVNESQAQSLRGSLAAMRAQHRQAEAHDFTFLPNSSEVDRFANELGLLVTLPGNADYRVHQVMFPVARPEVKLFVERLAKQYRNACGEQLVVTSLTRPKSRQPSNSSHLSVHPTGMAVDLRRSTHRPCRAWLEDVLLHLERAGKLEATRERNPPHYHIAVYPEQYRAYVAQLEARADSEARTAVEEMAQQRAERGLVRHEVRPGDSLWTIARAYGTTIDDLKAANKIRGTVIQPGQLLDVPAPGSPSR